MSNTGLEKNRSSANPTIFPSGPQKTQGQAPIAGFATYTGPIPPPEFLVQYEKTVPGSAKRFLQEPHIEAEHRRALEKKDSRRTDQSKL